MPRVLPPPRPLQAAEQQRVDRQEKLLAALRAALANARPAGRAHREEQRELREELAGATEQDRAALLAAWDRGFARTRALEATTLPSDDSPYFGHLRLRTGTGRVRDVLVGERSWLGGEPAILDWRVAPLARLLMFCDEGDDYALDIGARTVDGTVLGRDIVHIVRGVLVGVSAPGGMLRREPDAGWRYVPGASAELAIERPADNSVGVAELDPQQRQVVGHGVREPLLVIGSAGCGKTTVASHRVAQLGKNDHALVIVPERGLQRLWERLLAQLEVRARVELTTYEAWVERQARRVLPGLPPLAPTAPAGVSRLKRHSALLVAVDELLARTLRETAERVQRSTKVVGIAQAFVLGDHSLHGALVAAEAAIVPRLTEAQARRCRAACAHERDNPPTIYELLVALVGDHALLAAAVQASSGELGTHLARQTAERTGQQLEAPERVRYAHVDADRLQTLDGRSLDEDTPEEVSGTLDVEDLTLAFELLWRLTGHQETEASRLSRYDHVVLDEAQELGPIELRLLARTLKRKGRGITVAGDAAQQIDPTSVARPWEEVMTTLCVRGDVAQRVQRLETSHRCPRPVVDLGQQVLGPFAPAEPPVAAREGPPVLRTLAPTLGAAAAQIADGLRALRQRQPLASVAVIAHEVATAEHLGRALEDAVGARLVLDGEFAFTAGVEVTTVHEVKGLEFDLVVVPDLDAATYPDTAESRRELHVAVTRARQQVWLLGPEPGSPLVPGPSWTGGSASPTPPRSSRGPEGEDR